MRNAAAGGDVWLNGEEQMIEKVRTWEIADHLCRSCGGRILRCASGGGPTPGGNPIWKCADCGKTASGMTAAVLCWCGQTHRMNSETAYVCKSFALLKDRPHVLDYFRACGCDPKRGEVGIMLARDWHKPDPEPTP